MPGGMSPADDKGANMTTTAPRFTTIPERYTTGRQRVMMIDGPCQCGCKGRDPWHRQWFKRLVKDVQILDKPELERKADRVTFYTVATATIRCPWGPQAVQLTAYVRADGTSSILGTWKARD